MAETNAKSIEIFQGDGGQWYYHAKAGNGEIVSESEGYTTRESAVNAAEATFPSVPISVSTEINPPTEEDGA